MFTLIEPAAGRRCNNLGCTLTRAPGEVLLLARAFIEQQIQRLSKGERAYAGRIFKSREHSVRFHKSAEIMDFTIPYSVEELDAATAEELRRANEENATLRRSLLDLQNQIEMLRTEIARMRGSDEQLARDLADGEPRWSPSDGDLADDRVRSRIDDRDGLAAAELFKCGRAGKTAAGEQKPRTNGAQ